MDTALTITRSGDYNAPIGLLRSRLVATQWEYKVEELGPEACTFAQYRNVEGGEGWELVTVVELGIDDVGRSHAVFRRELANPTWER